MFERDQEAWCSLESQGFAGVRWDGAVEKLIGHTVMIMTESIRDGSIEARMGFVNLRPGDALSVLSDVTDEQVAEIVRLAVQRGATTFVHDARSMAGWRPTPDETITAHFVSTCLRELPGICLSVKKARERRSRSRQRWGRPPVQGDL